MIQTAVTKMVVLVTILSLQKSRFSLPKNVLTWFLCHLADGTPIKK
ncbi:hypothetical protein EMIT079MI2_360022 [Bacillus sp. IT-79MI2]